MACGKVYVTSAGVVKIQRSESGSRYARYCLRMQSAVRVILSDIANTACRYCSGNWIQVPSLDSEGYAWLTCCQCRKHFKTDVRVPRRGRPAICTDCTDNDQRHHDDYLDMIPCGHRPIYVRTSSPYNDDMSPDQAYRLLYGRGLHPPTVKMKGALR